MQEMGGGWLSPSRSFPDSGRNCILFPDSLWHGPASNVSGCGRKTLLYNYFHMCMRCYDYESVVHMMNRCTPRQRSLHDDLGYEFRPRFFFYAPEDEDDVIGVSACPAR